MNFLSHYYFDKHSANPNEVFGMLLPDLLKNTDKAWSIHPEKKEQLFLNNPVQNAILKGWKRHLIVDQLFHNSSFFKHHQHQIKLVIREEIIGSPVKPFFLGHISLELLLDNLLISENLISVKKLYALLEKVDESEIKLFLTLSRISEQDKFLRFFYGFLKDQYLYNYASETQITYALKRICMRLWENPFTAEQELAITKRLVEYKKKLREDFIFIFDLIDAQIN